MWIFISFMDFFFSFSLFEYKKLHLFDFEFCNNRILIMKKFWLWIIWMHFSRSLWGIPVISSISNVPYCSNALLFFPGRHPVSYHFVKYFFFFFCILLFPWVVFAIFFLINEIYWICLDLIQFPSITFRMSLVSSSSTLFEVFLICQAFFHFL